MAEQVGNSPELRSKIVTPVGTRNPDNTFDMKKVGVQGEHDYNRKDAIPVKGQIPYIEPANITVPPSRETTSDRPPSRVNYETYPQDYYTGAQVRVYFGGVWVDDIATIQYSTSHSKTPLYGYNDHQFRAVAKGQMLVRGQFTLAFKETGYLRSIINLIKNDNVGVADMLDITGDKTNKFMRYLDRGLTVEQALDSASFSGNSTKFGGNTPTSDFEDIAEVLEDSIWGGPYTPEAYKKRIPRSDELDYEKYTKGNKSTDIDRDGFDILLTFGNYNNGFEDAEHTMISINDIHITGESLIVTPADEPIGMQYEFFARGLNERVSQSWPAADQVAVEDPNDNANIADSVSKAIDGNDENPFNESNILPEVANV